MTSRSQLVRISVKITYKDRDYLDAQIKQGRFASYGHCFRGLLYYYRTTKRVVKRLEYDNAVMRQKLKESGSDDK